MTLTKKLLGAVGATALALAAAAPASAEDREFNWSGSLTIVSDYIFRGISFTNEDPTLQGYLEFTYGIAYVGFWASGIGGDDAAFLGPWEVDYYAGIRPSTGPVNWDFGVLYYTYGDRQNGADFNDDADYVEFQILASTTVDKFTFGLKGYYTPDQEIAAPETYTIEGTVAYALPAFTVSGAEWSPTLSGGVGYWGSEANDVYFGAGGGFFLGDDEITYWNAGLKITVERFFMDFRYWDTEVDANAGLETLADERFLFSAGVTFP
ncbi:MAG: TorF family putative porin [Hyphomicrobium sp.]|nr:TorF family putative porin [Hyphomicrobium sp.]